MLLEFSTTEYLRRFYPVGILEGVGDRSDVPFFLKKIHVVLYIAGMVWREIHRHHLFWLRQLANVGFNSQYEFVLYSP